MCMRRTAFFGAVAFILTSLFLTNVPAVFAAPPANFQSTLVAGSGLNGPSAFEFAPDGRIFILERAGKVKIYKNGQVLATPFVDLPSAASGDRGLIGIAFDPDFNTNHYVYFWYTSSGDFMNRLVRFTATGDVATDGPVQIYQTALPSQELHVGGGLAFGSDGKIYIGIGDNGYSANAQNMAVPFGKMMRINKDGTIPADNPYVGQANVLPEIWAHGLRNPWRAQFDSVTGRLYVSDVGDNSWEEVNMISRAGNYGWPTVEGMCTVNCGNFIDPVHTYFHDDVSSAVTGGPVYRGDMFPESYQGRYFFADYARGFIKSLSLNAAGTVGTPSDFDLSAGSVVDLKEAYDGSIYYITYYPGRLYRISYSEGNTIPVANAGADKTKGVEPLTVNFTSAGSFDPDGSPLTFNWNFGDGTTSTAANPIKTFTVKGAYTVTLHVSDGDNIAEAVPLVIQVGLPPTVRIAAPENNSLWRMGDTIFYTASGIDGAGFDLHDSDFTTEVLFHHDTHTHPFLGPIQSKTGTFAIPLSGEHDPDVWFEIMITAHDTNGLSTTERVNIYPVKSLYKVQTNIAGMNINIDGVPTAAPYESLGVVNYQRELEAPMFQTVAGKLYQFESWSDGGAAKHMVSVPENNVTWTATYQEVPAFTGQYFNNMNLQGAPVLTRQDPSIDFEWNAGSPAPVVNVNNFSARWTRTQIFGGGTYTFTTTTDDGVRLYIDDVMIMDNWQDQGMFPADSVTVDIAAGEHEIVMEYYDNQFDAIAKLTWSFVPGEPTPTPTPTTGGYNAAFWNTPTAGSAPAIPVTAPDVTRVDTAIDYDWGDVSPIAPIAKDHYVVRWTKAVTLQEGLYKFTTESDDGIRVYVDNLPLIDQWNDHGVTTHTAEKILTAGVHDIRVEYYENGWDAVAKFKYDFMGAATPIPTVTPTLAPTAVPTATASATPVASASATPVATASATPTPGAGSVITVYAAGIPALGVYPNMNLLINDVVVATFTNVDGNGNIPTYKPYTYTHASAVTGAQVKVLFTNDAYAGDDNDRNLRVDRITIDGVTYQSEDVRVYSTGADPGPGCAPGYQVTEWLNCNGYFQYFNQAVPTATPVATATPIATASATPVGTATPIPTGTPVSTNYFAEYWNNKTLTGPAALTRNETTIDHDWGMGSPDTIVPVDNFSARWTKTANLPSGIYRFTVTGDDGVRLFVDEVKVIDKWIDQGRTTYTVDLPLQTGNHAIRFEYFETGYTAVAKMSYTKTAELPVGPTPTAVPTPTATPFDGYVAQYWNTPGVGSAPAMPAGAPTLTRNEAKIDNYWGAGSPDASISVDKFIARWTRTTTFAAGTYQFWTESDDGIRVYIDDELVINQWNDHGVTAFTGNKTLTAGAHTIRVEYYEGGWDAVAKFNWTQL